MSKILITGVSSGIGRALTKRLVSQGDIVWGIARREHLLRSLSQEIHSPRFLYSPIDISKKNSWKYLIKFFSEKKFVPQIIIFNAAILKNDLRPDLDIKLSKKIFLTNFLSVIDGISALLPYIRKGAQFIAISSSSAYKGSSIEGLGYPASKAALSIAFESLYQRYVKDNIIFKTVYLGPVNCGMGPFKKKFLFVLSENDAIKHLADSIKRKKTVYYYPRFLFLMIKFMKLLPSQIYFNILSMLENIHLRIREK